MSFDLILRNIGRVVQLTEEEQKEFCSLLTIRHVKKKQLLVKPGEISLHENFINKGCFRNYIIDREGTERNFYFAIEGWWISDIHSRTFNVPSFAYVYAVEDSELVQILQTDLDNIMMKFPKLEHFFRLTYQKSTASIQFQLLQRLYLSAEEQYLSFRTKYPEFDRRIPQKHIATYLGFTPEFFNTVRTKILKQI
ncbi:Crp/Fnr family transcriptional regulator [Mucilaginibacter gilvus]|uniref:Crp/Fnr family transcriptional regulator n=1 Tax=Mucilaginibacter gilvus TaxID=2305909 RepID=A0A3S3UGW1_9SPHI|nr:Crp/Fnr family transcriptional regulator [Mucilaginibacter gilvus]RWY46077.1 Crp/Fnr family transcriptional regulator [Mucilaginibacter gilvus]